MKKFLVPVAVAAAAFGSVSASPIQGVPNHAVDRLHQGPQAETRGANALASLLMIPAVANIDTITQLPQHRSHASHASHRSHYSSRY